MNFLNWNLIINAGVGAFIALLLRELFILFFGEMIKEKFESRKYHISNKRELADQIIHICTEAISNRFKKPPNDMQHLIYIGNSILAYDKNLAEDYDRFCAAWVVYTIGKHDTIEELMKVISEKDKIPVYKLYDIVLKKALEMKKR